MTLTELLLSLVILSIGVGTWKVAASISTSRGHPEKLSSIGGAIVGVIAAIAALVVTAPPAREASIETAVAPLLEKPAARIELAAAAPIDRAALHPAVALQEASAPAAVRPLIEPAVAMAAESLPAVESIPEAAPPPEPTAAPLAAAPEPARPAVCPRPDGRAEVERRALRKFGRASDRLDPGEELVVVEATAVTMRLDDAQRRGARSLGELASDLAAGTRIKIHQRFGRPGEWVYYQIYLPDGDAWRYTTSRALEWVDRSPRGKQHEETKRRWIEKEVARLREPPRDEGAAQEACDATTSSRRS